ncbi:MAG: hypothetical protein AAF468_17475 [Pseudomonadota bacterium]
MKNRSFKSATLALAALSLGALTSATPVALAANTGKTIEIKGEIIDTWCYFSGVMGDTDAVVGSAHHTCALWCAAGGIPVGVLAEDGKVYMVLKYKSDDALAPTDAIMEVQSDVITAKGRHFLRDGMNYLIVDDVIANDGITNLNHEDYGAVPPFSAPKKPKKKK